MRAVCIVGIGQIPVRLHVGRSLSNLASSALSLAMQDAGMQSVPAVWISALLPAQTGKDQLAQALLADTSQRRAPPASAFWRQAAAPLLCTQR